MANLSSNFKWMLQIDFWKKETNFIKIIENIELFLRKWFKAYEDINDQESYGSTLLTNIKNAYEYCLSIINGVDSLMGLPKDTKTSKIFDKWYEMHSSEPSYRQILHNCKTIWFETSKSFTPCYTGFDTQQTKILTLVSYLYQLIYFISNNYLDFNEEIESFDLFEYVEKNDGRAKRSIQNSYKTMESSPISGETKSIYDFISELIQRKHILEMPRYQREYTWDSTNIYIFLEDIKKMDDQYERGLSGKQHYFGVIAGRTLFAETANKGVPTFTFRVIDGQQRLITSILFMCAARDIIRNNNNNFYTGINIIDDFFNVKNTSDPKVELKDFLKNPLSNEEENRRFKNIVVGDIKSINFDDNSTIIKNYLMIKNWLILQQNTNKNAIFNLCNTFKESFKIENVNFVKNFSTKDEISIFQNINSKGKPLSAHELIKNYLFNLCDANLLDNPKTFNEIDFTYRSSLGKQIFDSYEPPKSKESKNSNDGKYSEHMSEFLKALIHYFTGDDFVVTDGGETRGLLNGFTTILNKFFLKKDECENISLTLDEYKKLINQIGRYYKIFLAVKYPTSFQAKDISTILSSKTFILNMINLVMSKKKAPIYPLMFLIFDYFNENCNNDFNKLTLSADWINYITSMFFDLLSPLYKAFCIKGQGDSQTNRNYYKDINKAREQLPEKFDKNLNNAKLFFEKIMLNLNSHYNLQDARKSILGFELPENAISFFLQAIEWKMTGFDEAIIRQKSSIEHIMPKTWETNWTNDIKVWNAGKFRDEDEMIDLINKHVTQIGNCMLLSQKKNSKNSNLCFAKKKVLLSKKYTCSPLYASSIKEIDVSKKDKWTFKDIENRTKAFADYICSNILK